MCKNLKLSLVWILMLIFSPTIGQNKSFDSLKHPKDTFIINIPTSSTQYLKQAKGDTLKFEEINKQLDTSTFLAIFAVIISILAIYLPLRFNAKADRKSTFFKMYEYWNTDYMLKARRRFWKILHENRTSTSKVSLKRLRDKNPDDYHIYETVYDLLNDLARLYSDNHIDRRLAKTLMVAFIRSYGNALEEHFEYHETNNSFLVKMSAKYYQPVIALRNELCKGEPKTYAVLDDKEDNAEESYKPNA